MKKIILIIASPKFFILTTFVYPSLQHFASAIRLSHPLFLCYWLIAWTPDKKRRYKPGHRGTHQRIRNWVNEMQHIHCSILPSSPTSHSSTYPPILLSIPLLIHHPAQLNFLLPCCCQKVCWRRQNNIHPSILPSSHPFNWHLLPLNYLFLEVYSMNIYPAIILFNYSPIFQSIYTFANSSHCSSHFLAALTAAARKFVEEGMTTVKGNNLEYRNYLLNTSVFTGPAAVWGIL